MIKTMVPIFLYSLFSLSALAQLTPYDSAFLGKNIYHIKLSDSNGKTTTLEKFRGNYLYVDFWFTGCKPCIEEFPKAKELAATLTRDDIVLVTISFDTNDELWQKTLAKYAVAGEHFRVTTAASRNIFKDEFKIVYFPFYWLVGPEGNLIHPNAPRPGQYLQDNSLEKFIDGHR